MSLYCLGEREVVRNAGFIRISCECKRKEDCLLYKACIEYKMKNETPGYASGVWFVDVYDCVRNDYAYGVFYKNMR